MHRRGHGPAANPLGPYHDANAQPIVCQDGTGWGGPTIDTGATGPPSVGGSIDPDIFTTTAGSSFLLWKNDGNHVGQSTTIWSVPLTADLTLPTTSQPTALLTTDQTWQGGIIEGPEMYEHDVTTDAGTDGPVTTPYYYLFYSANAEGSANYAVGWASCSGGPASPCTDGPPVSNPLLVSQPGMSGPGGPNVLTLPRGRSSPWPSPPGRAPPSATSAAASDPCTRPTCRSPRRAARRC